MWAGISAVIILMAGADLFGLGLGTALRIYLKRRAEHVDEASKAND